MRLDGNVAVVVDPESRTDADGAARDAAKVGRDLMLLHPRIDDKGRGPKGDEVGQLESAHGDRAGRGEGLDDLDRRVRALADNSVDFSAVVVKRVMKSHAASDDRREGVVAQRDATALPGKPNRDGGGDLVRSEHDRIWLGSIGEKAMWADVTHAEAPF
jgi:hypothetical protein